MPLTQNKKNAPPQDSVKVYERNFYSHVLANLVRYMSLLIGQIRSRYGVKKLIVSYYSSFFILSLSDCKRTECNRSAESEIRKRQISKWVNRKWKVIMFSTETRWNYLLFCQWDSTFWHIICWWLVFLTKWPKRDFSCFFIIILSPEFFKFGKVKALLKKGDHCHVNNYGQIIVLQR